MSKWKKYSVCIGISARESMEYRVNYLINLLGCIMPIIMQVFLWTALYSGSKKDMLYGYTYNEMIMYSLLAGIISKLVQNNTQYAMADDIKSGALNKFLIQPIDHFVYRVSIFLGQKTQHFMIVLFFAACVLIFSGICLHVVFFAGNVVLAILALILGIFLDFTITYCIGALTFWFNQVTGFFGTLALVSSIISGGVFSLDIFGPFWNKVFQFLPFRYLTYFQISIVTGRLAMPEILWGLVLQLLWIGLFLLLSRFLWRRGLIKYVAIGG